MNTYIVRIYRIDDGGAECLTGIVETVGCDYQKVFNTSEELWEILRSADTDRYAL